MLGILGGTFDPIHNGHIAIARAVCMEFNLSELRFLPCGQHAFEKKIVADKAQRLAMLKLALQHEPKFKIDTQELDRKGVSYTIDTLKTIRHEIGDQQSIGWIIGMDAFLTLPLWHKWQNLLQYCHLIVLTRTTDILLSDELKAYVAQHETTDKKELEHNPAGKIYFLNIPPSNISATEIRKQLKAGEISNDMLPEKVVGYIKKHHLYKS